jgi:hypothetical protein
MFKIAPDKFGRADTLVNNGMFPTRRLDKYSLRCIASKMKRWLEVASRPRVDPSFAEVLDATSPCEQEMLPACQQRTTRHCEVRRRVMWKEARHVGRHLDRVVIRRIAQDHYAFI